MKKEYINMNVFDALQKRFAFLDVYKRQVSCFMSVYGRWNRA